MYSVECVVLGTCVEYVVLSVCCWVCCWVCVVECLVGCVVLSVWLGMSAECVILSM